MSVTEAHRLERWLDKVCTAEQAVQSIKSGQRVFVGTACATPTTLTNALEARNPAPDDVELFHFLTTNMLPVVDGKPTTKYRHRTFFVGTEMRELVNRGLAEYVPVSLLQVPALIVSGRIRADVALVQVSPPDEFGYVSLGVSVDMVATAVRYAKRVIAEVNPNMPRTLGESFIHISKFDKLVPVDSPVAEFLHEPLDELAQQIARYVAEIIEDGSTLQVGLGRIPNEALKYLTNRKDLGVHSDVITDAILGLIDAGVVTGARKSLHPHRIVTSYCIGSKRLYDVVNNNPLFKFLPIEQVADAGIIRQNTKMVSLTQAFSIDLTGQVCTDQFGGQFYGGVSTQPEFLRGASLAENGKPIVCLRSTTADDSESCIRPLLPVGEGVTIARSDVHYVVTEYGIAYLFAKSVRERAIALIEIAHPKFRAQLLEEAKKLGYALPEQKLDTLRPYLIEEERTVSLKGDRQVLIRPARSSDAMGMKEIFYQLSKDDVYTRFFRRVNALSFNEAQRLCNVNFDTEVAFVAVTGMRDNEQIAGSCCYFLNPSTNLAEVAYMIAPEWQATGLGGALQKRMMEFAKKKGVRGFVAEILAENTKMIALAKRACDNVKVHMEDGMVEIVMIFD
ncbi:GNAT family N-acetyltransferase [Propionivibrio sp.]|uniref:GNAT family N-acetyltransferase n=1 Tax=Propionivibrio sp. TaxID=2212460 RepID=UPI003BF22F27